MSELRWPHESARGDAAGKAQWSHARSNICLDFHGDPRRARLVVFSDGNHHMALEACLRAFLARHPQVEDVFYATTPPAVLLRLLDAGELHLGNLCLALTPHVFISPPDILERVVQSRRMDTHVPFMRSRGNVLLVRKGNPKGIAGVADLARMDVRLFLSNPVTETASHRVYVESLRRLARSAGVVLDVLDAAPGAARVCYGERIHHREAPQALADERADVAMIYYHLALRYTRVFPDVFDLVPLGDALTDPGAETQNVVSDYHLGLIGDGGEWGSALRDFLMGETATLIYEHHGLRRPDGI
jgi:DNA-binding transcriptional LysR family regulator